jgi:hypothetical protein
MNENEFGRVFEIVWSLFAISGSVYVLFNRNWFIQSNSKIFLKLYQKTNISLFKYQAEGMNQDYMHLLVIVLSILFILTGMKILFGGLI